MDKRSTGISYYLNAKSDLGEIRVELLDMEDKPLPGYSLDDCQPVVGDSASVVVRWIDRPNLQAAAGQTVRLRFHPKNARLYSYRCNL